MNHKLLALYGLKFNPFSPELPVDAIYVPQRTESFCWRIEHAQIREGGFAMVHGDPGADIWGMDVARYGDYATLAYTNAKVQENYRRRFRITFPNEELPDARPLLTTPIYDRLTAANAVWGASFGLEHALWFQAPGLEPREEVTFRRSNAWSQVAAEVEAVRERVGMTEISNYAKYRVTGPRAEAWLSSLLTARMPRPGRITLTAMLNEAGRIVGEFTVARPDEDDTFYLFGSLPAEVHHSRWFRHHLPADGSVRFEVLGLGLTGLSVTGPRSRDVLGTIAPDLDLQLKKHGLRTVIVIGMRANTCIESTVRFAAELGYEVTVVKDATADYSDEEMHAALDVNIPNYASAIVTAAEVVDSISSL